MDEIRFLSTIPTGSSAISKSVHSPSATQFNSQRQRIDSASVIQQADVSSSRPALLAHDALGSLVFETLDGFFFTVNHNCEFDSVSDNVGQYLKFTQEELTGRNLYHCVHPSDVGEFSKAWTTKDAGDPLDATSNVETSRGRTFLCRMKTYEDSSIYTNMLVSIALHRESSNSDKTYLICIARRAANNQVTETHDLLGFDQFSSRINLQFDIEGFDASHMKCQTFDIDYYGKKFQDFVHPNDIPLIQRHFQEVIELGESISSIYRFCLRDGCFAFVTTKSKLLSRGTSTNTDWIMSTHTIIRLIDGSNELSGNPSTRLLRSIILSNRDLQRNRPSSTNRTLPITPNSTQPIGTQFAMTMLGIHKNPSNTLQQHVSHTLGTLAHVQSSFSSPLSTPVEKSTVKTNRTPPPVPMTPKTSPFDNVTSSATLEFGSKRPLSFSQSFASVSSHCGSLPSPGNSLDSLLPCFSPSNDLNSLLPSPSSTQKKSSSPLHTREMSTGFLPINEHCSNPMSNNTSRSSMRLRQLLTNKSPSSTIPSPTQMIQTPQDLKMNSNSFDDPNHSVESPTTTHISPSPSMDLSSPSGRRIKSNSSTPPGDALLKQILGRQTPVTPILSDESVSENPFKLSANSIKAESQISEENSTSTKTLSTILDSTATKLRSDTFLRTLLNDEIRQQKVLVEAPFTYGARTKSNSRGSGGANLLLGPNQNKSIGNSSQTSLKTQVSLDIDESAIWDKGNNRKKQRQNSHTYGSKSSTNVPTLMQRKSGRLNKRDTSDYLLFNPQTSYSDNSLDAFLDTSVVIDQPPPRESSPIVVSTRRGQSSTMKNNLKRSTDAAETPQSCRKYPKLLTQALKDDVKVESMDSSIISPSIAVAATRPVHSSSQSAVKVEADLLDLNGPSKRSTGNQAGANNQPSLLRSLIRTPQPSKLASLKDEPLYDLLRNLDNNDSSIFSSLNSISSSTANLSAKKTSSSSIDPLDQGLTSDTLGRSVSTKDEYLATLLSSDPQRPSEISFTPVNKQQSTPNLVRSSSQSSEMSSIAAIVNDLFDSTSAAPAPLPSTMTNNDDFLSFLDGKELLLDCFNEASTNDSILAETPSNLNQPATTSILPKQNEKDEKAISEIYKTLVTSFNPGPSSLDLPVDSSPFSSLAGDFLFADNNSNSAPPNRTVNMDPSMNNYRSQNTNYSYQNSQGQQTTSNSSQYTDCLPTDMIDGMNGFPPNVTLSPMHNSFLSSTVNSNMEDNPMIPYQQTNTIHNQHHQSTNQFYRQPSQVQQSTLYNNYNTQSPVPNQVAPHHYPSQQQQISPHTHVSPFNKRSNTIQAQRTVNQQLQLHVSSNGSLSNMQSNNSQQQQPQQRPMMDTFNDLLMSNGDVQDFHSYSSTSIPSNNTLDLPFNHDMFMSSSTSGMTTHQQQQPLQMHQRHGTMVPSNSLTQTGMHQSYPNMNAATVQQGTSHNSNNSTNPMECRQSEELNNQMMNCLSFQPARCTSEFVRKQLQNTIQGRQKPAGGKDTSLAVPSQKLISPSNLDSNQKGAYFRNQLSTPMTNPPLQPTSIRSQLQQQPPSHNLHHHPHHHQQQQQQQHQQQHQQQQHQHQQQHQSSRTNM